MNVINIKQAFVRAILAQWDQDIFEGAFSIYASVFSQYRASSISTVFTSTDF